MLLLLYFFIIFSPTEQNLHFGIYLQINNNNNSNNKQIYNKKKLVLFYRADFLFGINEFTYTHEPDRELKILNMATERKKH